jgi:hypothetical protein
VQNFIIAKHILNEQRIDCLGRSVYHTLYDAGLDVALSSDHVDLADCPGRTPLYMACRVAKETDVDSPLKMGAKLGQYAVNRLVPLQVAVIYGTKGISYNIWWRRKDG